MLTVNAGPIALTVAPDWRMLLTTGAIACAATVMSSLLPAIFLQTTVNLDRVDPGFNPDRLVSFRVEPALSGYDRAHSEPTHARIMDRTGAVPGVTSVSMLSVPLLAGRALAG